MIKKLRRKIFWSIELSALGVLFLILTVYNGLQIRQSEIEEWQMLSVVLDQLEQAPSPDGWMPDRGFKEDRQRKGPGRRGTAKIIQNLASSEISLIGMEGEEKSLLVPGFLWDYEDGEWENITDKIAVQGKEKGTLQGIKYMLYKEDGYTYMVLLRAGYIDGDVLRMAGISLAGFLLAGILFGLIAYQLSLRIVRPVEETIENQKQFIADASHELKTPVAVISANLSILEKETGQNRWLEYIKKETRRMTELTENLLMLSKIDHDREQTLEQYVSFDLSEVLMEAALPFESIAFEKGVHYDIQIPDQIMANGIPEDYRQIAGILLDNALKHTQASGSVSLLAKVSACDRKQKTKSQILLSVRNTGPDIPEDALEHLFERFYKLDTARTYQENSFGLGLAIARALAEKNGGTLSVTSQNQITEFTASFPLL